MTLNQNLRSTKCFAVIGYTGSKRSIAICCFLKRNEIITENEKKVNILIAFQFYQLLFYFWQICRRRSTRSSRSLAHFENPALYQKSGNIEMFCLLKCYPRSIQVLLVLLNPYNMLKNLHVHNVYGSTPNKLIFLKNQGSHYRLIQRSCIFYSVWLFFLPFSTVSMFAYFE